MTIDTKDLCDCGNDILTLTKQLSQDFDGLFSRLSDMNSVTGEWVGQGAVAFIARCNTEKIQYDKLVDTLLSYGNTLTSAANEYEKQIKDVLEV